MKGGRTTEYFRSVDLYSLVKHEILRSPSLTWIESPNAGELNTAARQNVLVITSNTPKTQESTQLCSNTSQQPQQLAKRKHCRLEVTSNTAHPSMSDLLKLFWHHTVPHLSLRNLVCVIAKCHTLYSCFRAMFWTRDITCAKSHFGTKKRYMRKSGTRHPPAS